MSKYLYFLFFIFSFCQCAVSVEGFKNEILTWPKSSASSSYFPLYKRIMLGRASFTKEPQIEKIIHQIWLGGAVPERFKNAMDSWKKIHPDWEYRLWTDKDVEEFGLENKKYFDTAENYGIKSDLMRFEILYRYGGLYVDCDQYCLKRHDIFHHCCQLYVGNMISRNENPTFANSLIGAKKNSSFILKLIQGIPHSYRVAKKDNLWDYTLEFTGPFYLTKKLHKLLKNSSNFIAFSNGFFNPLPMECGWGDCPDALDKSYCQQYLEPFTYSVQYHTGSWG